MRAQDWSERTSRLGTWLRSIDPWIIDGGMATVFVVASIVGLYAVDDSSGFHYRDPDAFAIALTFVAAACYAFRRRSPLAVLLVSEFGVVVLTAREYQTGATPTLLMVGVYTLGAWSPPRDRAIGALGMALGLGIVAITGIPGSSG